MTERSRIWTLMARKLSGEATPDELTELERLQQQHPEITYSLQLIEDLYRSRPPLEETKTEAEKVDAGRWLPAVRSICPSTIRHARPT